MTGDKLTLILSGDLRIELSEKLATTLGFQKREYDEAGSYPAHWAPSLKANVDYIYTYTNICEYVNVGNVKAPLLCAVPYEIKSNETTIRYSFTNPTFVKVRCNDIRHIDIKLCDGAGSVLPFKDGKTIVLLQFRRSFH